MVRLHTDDGRERLVLIRTSQISNGDGQVQGLVATIKDITEEMTPIKREVIADSPAMRQVLSFVKKVAASEATTILLEGEDVTALGPRLITQLGVARSFQMTAQQALTPLLVPAAILARARAIPAVVGLGDLSAQVEEGDFVLVDGHRGVVVVRPDREQIR